MGRTFDELVSEAAAAPIDGWDFSWLDGRATEERPSWGYQHLMSRRLATATAALDIDTGGGEVLAGAETFPPTMVATESWPPNAALATQLLHPLGAVVVATRDEPTLPFADAAFDLVTSRHATGVKWNEIARVLRPAAAILRSRSVPPRCPSCSSIFSDHSRPNGLSCNRIPKLRKRKPRVWRSSRCGWNGCVPNSSMSAP